MSGQSAAGWRPHDGDFKQATIDTSRSYDPQTVKWSAGGRRNYALDYLEQLYCFSSLIRAHDAAASSREAQLIFGAERFCNVGNLTYAFEFCLYENAKHTGKQTTALVAGGKKARRAREKAAVALRGKWWPKVGGQREEDYRGWIELYDPRAFSIRKIDIRKISTWSKELVQEIGDHWRAYNGAGGPGFGRRMDSTRVFTGKVIYSSNWLREHKLPLATICTVHLREIRPQVANQMLVDLAESGASVEEFDFNKFKALYD